MLDIFNFCLPDFGASTIVPFQQRSIRKSDLKNVSQCLILLLRTCASLALRDIKDEQIKGMWSMWSF